METKKYQSGNTIIPDYDKHCEKLGKQKIGLITPLKYQDVNDKIMDFWANHAHEISESASKLSSALSNSNLPELEKKIATQYLEEIQQPFGYVVGRLTEIADGTKFKWKEIKIISEKADELNNLNTNLTGQITALMVVLGSRDVKKVDMPQTRSNIAWHIIDEIATVGLYRQLEYIGADWQEDIVVRTTVDEYDEEKEELELAIKDKVVRTEKEIEEMTVSYQALRDIINSDNNNVPTDLTEHLDDIWLAGLKGEGTHKYSAIHFLKLGEKVFKGIKKGGGFDAVQSKAE